jgi:hypothetical protein
MMSGIAKYSLRAMAAVVVSGLVTFSMLGCHSGPSADEIGSTVKTSMQSTFDTDPNFIPEHFKVDKVVAVKKTDTTYDGTASINYQGQEHDVPVAITMDGTTANWKVAPGGFAFAQ